MSGPCTRYREILKKREALRSLWRKIVFAIFHHKKANGGRLIGAKTKTQLSVLGTLRATIYRTRETKAVRYKTVIRRESQT